MASNILPRVTDQQLESGVFQMESKDGPVLERPLVTPLRDIESFSLMWLWPERIPLEKVTFLVGPADAGKSLLAADLAARVSRGTAWPDRRDVEQECGDVLYVCDSPETVNAVGPRLEQAGADRDLVHVFSETLTTRIPDARPLARGLTFPDDIRQLAFAVEKLENRQLLIIDSLCELCPDATRQMQTVRLLHRLAEQYSVAVVVLSRGHGERDGQGRIEVVNDRALAAARCVWTIAENPDEPGLREFLPARFSYGPRPGGLAFRIHDGQIAWEQANGLTRRRPSRAVVEVMLWLENLLHGQALASKMIQQEARECGFSPATLRAARLELGVQMGKVGFRDGSYWCWSLGRAVRGETDGQHPMAAAAPHQDKLSAETCNQHDLGRRLTEDGEFDVIQAAAGPELTSLGDGRSLTPGAGRPA